MNTLSKRRKIYMSKYDYDREFKAFMDHMLNRDEKWVWYTPPPPKNVGEIVT